MQNLAGKKLLVLGGVYQHCKVVEAAHELGVQVIVDDYLPPEQAPAKQMAEKYYMHNITDIDDIVAMCIEEKVDGVISTSLDACQRPYQQICERLGLPCFGTQQQYRVLTDKNEFKKQLKKSGLDVIPEYCEADFASEDVCSKKVEFPVFVKPCDSRGSRGQSICNNYQEAKVAIAFAREESATGQVVIEKYMGQANDFSMSLLIVNGTAYPFRTVDRILGKYEDGLDKLAVGAAIPSVFTGVYMDHVQHKIQKFISDIGIVTAPVFMQGFVDGETIRFYDPGLRFGGSEFERMFKVATGKNVFYPLIEYALTGKASDDAVCIKTDDVWLGGKTSAHVFPTLRAGTIGSVAGVEEIRKHPNVVSLFERLEVGDTVKESHNVGQRFGEVNLVCDSAEQMCQVVAWVYETLQVRDTNGEDMMVSQFDPELFVRRKAAFEKA